MKEAECRRVVAARSRGTCERCLLRPAVEMCHRKPRSQGGRWEPANIYHGCEGCHRWETQHPMDAHRAGFRLWRSEDPELTPLVLGGRARWLFTNDGRRLVA